MGSGRGEGETGSQIRVPERRILNTGSGIPPPGLGMLDVPGCAAAVSCTGPVWSTGTGTALWFGSSHRCRPEGGFRGKYR